MSTSVAYLRKRLADIGRNDLLEAAEAGLVSYFAAAEEAGLVRRKEVLGTGSPNQAKKRLWALSKITRGARPLPKLEPDEPAISPMPAQPMFSQATRDVIARLVEAGRVDLVIAVTERRISPFQAARIAERGDGRRRAVSAPVEMHAEEVEHTPKPEKNSPAKPPPKLEAISKLEEALDPPEKLKLDVRALIG